MDSDDSTIFLEVYKMSEQLKDKDAYESVSKEKKVFYKELFGLAIPIGMQNLLVALIGASDALMLGRLTQDAVAAVSLANQIAFIMNLFSGAIVGGGRGADRPILG